MLPLTPSRPAHLPSLLRLQNLGCHEPAPPTWQTQFHLLASGESQMYASLGHRVSSTMRRLKTASMCMALCRRKKEIVQICVLNSLAGTPLQGVTSGPGVSALGLRVCDKLTNSFSKQKFCFTRSSLGNNETTQVTGFKEQQQNASSGEYLRPEDGNGAVAEEAFPSGELEYRNVEGWGKFLMRLKMLTALPWQRVKKGSVLKMKLSGKITEQLQARFSSGVSLPQICENLIKAMYDPRILGVYLHIDPLDCGWGKIDEIRRHILFYKKSGKFIIAYMTVGGEKEYYLARACGELYAPSAAYITLFGLKVQASFFGGCLEKVGIEPQVQRIGKYKSLGDLISRKDMSEANREMLTALLDDIFDNWLQETAIMNGKTKEDVEKLLEEGIFEIDKLKQGGWLTDIKYEDEVDQSLKERLAIKNEKQVPYVDYSKYSRVQPWTLNLAGGKEQIAVLRAVGSISRVRGGINTSGDGIISDQFIEKIRQVREAKNFKAVILRIDSPGGDALASDLMWRELRLLSAKKPVIASMVDVAASGGYYMAMATDIIVAENLTLTGSIGVVTGKFNLGQLYEKVGFSKEIISRGRFSELDAEQRPFRPDEKELFAKSAQNAYKQFRDKAALSRSMEIEKMEEVAQGRVWTGKAAKDRGLVDAIGGFSKAVAIAKQKAGIPQETKVTLVELSRRSRSVTDILRSGVSTFAALFDLLKTDGGNLLLNDRHQGRFLLDDFSAGVVQARMENIIIEGLNGDASALYLASEICKGYMAFINEGEK